jgi:hypothetical protein
VELGQSELVGEREGVGGEQLWQAVERRGQTGRTKRRAAAAGLDHCHLAGPVNLVRNAEMMVEADEIGAAAEERMLAVVDDFVDAGMEIGTGATTEVAAALDELHAEASLGESAGRAHAGDTCADDGDGLPVILFLAGLHPISSGAKAPAFLRPLRQSGLKP